MDGRGRAYDNILQSKNKEYVSAYGMEGRPPLISELEAEGQKDMARLKLTSRCFGW